MQVHSSIGEAQNMVNVNMVLSTVATCGSFPSTVSLHQEETASHTLQSQAHLKDHCRRCFSHPYRACLGEGLRLWIAQHEVGRK